MKEQKLKIENKLKIIGWSLGDCGCDHYCFVDQEGKETKLMWWHDRIYIQDEYRMTVYFSLKDVVFKELKSGEAIAISARKNKDVFILLCGSKSGV